MSIVKSSREGALVRITLNQPERANAMSAGLVEALLDAVGEAIDGGARVVVLDGAGRSFCGGFDLGGLDEESDATLVHRFLRIEQLLQLVHYAPCYTVALAHGPVVGAGADLVAACARRVADPGASFRFPGARFGVALGTARLVQLVGSRARSLVLEQQTVDAAEAARIDLVDTIAPVEAWDAIVAGIAARAPSVPAETAKEVMALDQAAGARDLGVLARSIIEPGLKARMQAYWQSVRAASRSAAPRTDTATTR